MNSMCCLLKLRDIFYRYVKLGTLVWSKHMLLNFQVQNHWQSSPFDSCDCMHTCQHLRHQFNACEKQYTTLLFIALLSGIWSEYAERKKKHIKFKQLMFNNHLNFVNLLRSLVVSDFCSKTKGSWFEPGCQLYAEVSSLQ